VLVASVEPAVSDSASIERRGPSLIALIPPTGLLAFLAYWRAGYVDLQTGVLLIPGVFIGGILGGMMARQLNARRMAEVFAGLMFLLGGLAKSFPHGADDAYYVDMVIYIATILPGIDDGAQTIEDSLAMAEDAIQDGITCVVATPHASTEYQFDYKKVRAARDELQGRLGRTPDESRRAAIFT